MILENIKQDFKHYLKESDNIVVKGSYKHINFIQFEDFDIADENGRNQRKGEIKKYERDNFEETYDLELPKKKSDFPFIAEYKENSLVNSIKVKIVDETDTGYFLIYSGIKTGFVLFWEGNENIAFLVNKKFIKEFKRIDSENSRELTDLYNIAKA